MSTPLYKCANCGAVIHRLNLRCGYCNHWNVDPADPQDPPSATPHAAPTHAAVQPPPAPVAAPAPVAVSADGVPKRRLFGSKAEIAPPAAAVVAAPTVGERRGGGIAAPVSKPRPAPVAVSPKTRVLQSTTAQPETSSLWDRGRKSFNSRAAPADREEQESLARIQAVMAVAYWVATSDDEDEMDDDEYDAIVDTFTELLGADVDEEELETAIAAWDEAIEEDEEAFLAEAVAAIGQGPMRRQALEIATVVAAADDDLSDTEEESLGELSALLGFADRESERIIEKALESLEE